MDRHLSDEEIEGFRRSALDATQLLIVADHLKSCHACRNRTMPAAVLASKLGRLQQEFLRHLTDEELAAWTDGRKVEDPALVEAHLERCGSCRQEIADLHAFQQKLKPARRRAKPFVAWAALAAAAVLVIAVVSERRPVPMAPVASNKPAETRTLGTAPSPRTIQRAPVLDELFRPEGQLLGENKQHIYHALSPVGIVTMSDRPAFRWEAIPGASEYSVAVYDKDFGKVTESSKLRSNDWTPAEPLPRGMRLSWQVSASVGGKSVRLPVPPAREAVFEVMSADTAKGIADARDIQHVSAVELGLMYSRAGALEDAKAEFSKTSEARDLLESVEKELQRQNPVPTITKPAQ